MTTFTSDDRKNAYDPGLTCVTPSSANGLETNLVAEAPYHPGYEDAIIPPKNFAIEMVNSAEYNQLLKEVEAYRQSNARYMAFSKIIVNSFKKG